MSSVAPDQTWFFHARVYSGALRAAPDDVALLDVRCPRCGAEYVATADRELPDETSRGPRAAEDAAAVLAAETTLALECPDHPHRFAVTA